MRGFQLGVSCGKTFLVDAALFFLLVVVVAVVVAFGFLDALVGDRRLVVPDERGALLFAGAILDGEDFTESGFAGNLPLSFFLERLSLEQFIMCSKIFAS